MCADVAFAAQVQSSVRGIQEAAEIVQGRNQEPEGIVRITALEDFGRTVLASIVAVFTERYPKVTIYLDLNNRVTNLVDEGFDLGIRAGAMNDSSLIAKKLMRSEFWLAASPIYLKSCGVPKSLRTLAHHRCILFRERANTATWKLQSRTRTSEVKVASSLIVNSFGLATALAVRGAGVVLAPSFVLEPEIKSGRLARVLPTWHRRAGAVHIVYPANRYLPRRVQLFKDFLIDIIAG